MLENGVLLLVWVPFYTVSSSISRSAYSKQKNRRASARCPGTQPTPCGSQNCFALLAISSTALVCSETCAFFTAALRKPRENVREEGGGESAGRGGLRSEFLCGASASEHIHGHLLRRIDSWL